MAVRKPLVCANCGQPDHPGKGWLRNEAGQTVHLKCPRSARKPKSA